MFAHKILTECSNAYSCPYYSYNLSPEYHPHHLTTHLENGFHSSLILLGPERDGFLKENLYGKIKALKGTIFTVTQIRHPLDLIVSQYFSHGWLHPETYFDEEQKQQRNKIQNGNLLMFDYALQEIDGSIKFGGNSIIHKYNLLYQHFVTSSDSIENITVKYEDMVLTYAQWCYTLSGHLQMLDVLPKILSSLKPKYPSGRSSKQYYGEDVLIYVREALPRDVHIRSPLPGDHIRFITKQQVDHLMKIYSRNSEIVRIHYLKGEF